jgi:hypothetical protein
MLLEQLVVLLPQVGLPPQVGTLLVPLGEQVSVLLAQLEEPAQVGLPQRAGMLLAQLVVLLQREEPVGVLLEQLVLQQLEPRVQ